MYPRPERMVEGKVHSVINIPSFVTLKKNKRKAMLSAGSLNVSEHNTSPVQSDRFETVRNSDKSNTKFDKYQTEYIHI